MTAFARNLLIPLAIVAAVLAGAVVLEQIAFHVGIAHADTGSGSAVLDAGVGSNAGSATAPTPPVLQDPVANPLGAASQLETLWKSAGWTVALLVGVIFLLELGAWGGKNSGIAWLTWLGKGRVSIVIAGGIAIGLAMFNAIALGGKWSAALGAGVAAMLTYWHQAGTDPAKG